MFASYLAKWRLLPDGEPIVTRAAQLLPVLWRGEPAMLKLSIEEDERLGGAVMEWWDGDGAARVLAREGHALLLERATGPESLSDMARTGRDDEASHILCLTAARLHKPRGQATAGFDSPFAMVSRPGTCRENPWRHSLPVFGSD